jgi:hypothetical protein
MSGDRGGTELEIRRDEATLEMHLLDILQAQRYWHGEEPSTTCGGVYAHLYLPILSWTALSLRVSPAKVPEP